MPKVCQYCEVENDDGVIFCYQCGTEIMNQKSLAIHDPNFLRFEPKVWIDYRSFFRFIIQFFLMAMFILVILLAIKYYG